MQTKQCSQCKQVRSLKVFSKLNRYPGKYEASCYLCKRERNNTRNRALRVMVLAHYGGIPPRCACCNEEALEFLSLDHINGGGRQHRKSIKVRWWEWLRRSGFPKGFRVLCHNCNQSIGIYGYCPHTTPESRLRTAFAAYDEFAPNKGHKLSTEKAKKIRRLIEAGVSQCKIAVQFKVSRATVCLINKGKRWGSD